MFDKDKDHDFNFFNYNYLDIEFYEHIMKFMLRFEKNKENLVNSKNQNNKPYYFTNQKKYICIPTAKSINFQYIQDDVTDIWDFANQNNVCIQGEQIYFNPYFKKMFYTKTNLPILYSSLIVDSCIKIMYIYFKILNFNIFRGEYNSYKLENKKVTHNPYCSPIPSSSFLYRLKCMYGKSAADFIPNKSNSVWSACFKNHHVGGFLIVYDYNGIFLIFLQKLL